MQYIGQVLQNRMTMLGITVPHIIRKDIPRGNCHTAA